MTGPTEFNITGSLRDFDRTADLNKITEPILFMAGEFDEARPETMYKYQKLSRNARVQIIEDAAHKTMIDQPEKVYEVISKFLNEVDRCSEKASWITVECFHICLIAGSLKPHNHQNLYICIESFQ